MKRERITITIESELLSAVDALIDHESIRNRSHALEAAVKRGLMLTEITDVYFIYGNTIPNHESTKKIVQLCAGLEIIHSHSIAPSSHFSDASTWHASFLQESPCITSDSLLPADFGSAGALLLHKETVSPSFLIIDLEHVQGVPHTLLSAYAFHRQQGKLITHVVHPAESGFLPSGITFAQAELLKEIPAGKASLQVDVFPHLAKEGKVSAYVYAN